VHHTFSHRKKGSRLHEDCDGFVSIKPSIVMA